MTALEISGGFILIGLVLIVIVFIVLLYNGLITLCNNADKTWANIDMLLKNGST